ncbi:MAG: transketolase-like TK C-terminal-containing protein, partial [Acidimicrobiales bacterium]
SKAAASRARATAKAGAGDGGAGAGGAGDGHHSRRASLWFSGSVWSSAMEARDILARDWGVSADAWSVTSYKALREDALSVERWNRLHPGKAPRTPHITDVLAGVEGPVVAVTDYMKAVPDQVARWVPTHFTALGTDGFGRSDTRTALRRHFEVDASHVVVAVLAALAARGEAKPEEVADAIARYGIDADAVDPRVA